MATLPMVTSTRTFGPQLSQLHKVLDKFDGYVRQLAEPSGLQLKQILQWEHRHLKRPSEAEGQQRFRLPEELKEFLCVANGFTLEWSIRVRSVEHPIGCLKIWPLDRMTLLEQPHQTDDVQACEIHKLLPMRRGSDYEVLQLCQPTPREALVLVIFSNADKSEVWFRDVSMEWIFISDGFKSYVRLLIEHLGILHWHYAYSPAGVDPTTDYWLRLLAPARSRISLDTRAWAEATPGGRGKTLADSMDLSFLDDHDLPLEGESKERLHAKRGSKLVRGTNHQAVKANQVRLGRSRQAVRPASAPLRTAGSRRGCRGK